MPRRPAPPLWSSLALDRSASASLQDQIVGYFRDAVLSGRLKGGARVPSSRVLAADHDVARITVVEAYDRLVAEGFLTSRPGSGLFVAAIEGEAKVRLVAGTSRRQRKRMPELRRNGQLFLVPERPLGLLPLSPGVPALDRFPWRDWARITARLLRERPAHALGYDDPRGDCGLRQAIAEYLGQARGIACTADQVIVVAGSQQGIDLTARVVAAPVPRRGSRIQAIRRRARRSPRRASASFRSPSAPRVSMSRKAQRRRRGRVWCWSRPRTNLPWAPP